MGIDKVIADYERKIMEYRWEIEEHIDTMYALKQKINMTRDMVDDLKLQKHKEQQKLDRKGVE